MRPAFSLLCRCYLVLEKRGSGRTFVEHSCFLLYAAYTAVLCLGRPRSLERRKRPNQRKHQQATNQRTVRQIRRHQAVPVLARHQARVAFSELSGNVSTTGGSKKK